MNAKLIAATLAHLLADTYILYTKNQSFHWNVKSKQFQELHKFFGDQYEALENAIDTLAERIRALDLLVPISHKKIIELSRLEESTNALSDSAMLSVLITDHSDIIASINSAIEIVKKEDDQATMNLLIDRLTEHQKTLWMLKSMQ